jgi:hypothetical protein
MGNLLEPRLSNPVWQPMITAVAARPCAEAEEQAAPCGTPRSEVETRQPFCTKPAAIMAPIPEPPPVMSTTWGGVES